MIYFKDKLIHFIGIGGIGMSAIAENLHEMGIKVQGSDIVESANTRRLQQQSIKVFIGQKDPHVIDNVDVAIISSATPNDCPELVAALKKGIPVGHRSEMLSQLMRYKQGVAIAGTHGKTTTSAMITHLMIDGGFDPSAIVGGIMNNYDSNSVLGHSDWIVVEADESDGSFLRLNKTVAVVTSMDPEHLDYYGTVEQMNLAFLHFLQTTSFYGFCVVCTDHPVVKQIAQKVSRRRMISYGLSPDAAVRAVNIRISTGLLEFDIIKNGTTYPDFKLPMFGRHNILNALAAFAVVSELGMSIDNIRASFANFQGVQRRFTKRGTWQGIPFYDDYAHHPEEIKATLKAAREAVGDRRIVAVFQPHRYTRLQELMDAFAKAFDEADVLFICDVYSAGQQPIAGVNKEALIAKMHGKANVFGVSDQYALCAELKKTLKPDDFVIGLGAGSISKWIALMPQMLEDEKE